MAATIVRDTGKQTGSSVGTDSASFAALPAVGNHVIIGTAIWQSADPAMIDCSDNQSNTYTEDIELEMASRDVGASIYSTKVATSSGTFTVTINPSGAAWVEWIAFEVSGLDATTHLDKTGTNNSATGSANVTASAANSTSSGIAIAVAAVNAADTNIAINGTPPTGYTILAFNNNADSTVGYALAYKIYSSSETSSASFTHDAPTGWVAVIATYKDTGGGGGGGGTIPLLALLGAGA